LPVTDLFFRSLFAFFIMEVGSRKVVLVGVLAIRLMPREILPNTWPNPALYTSQACKEERGVLVLLFLGIFAR
jgi:hypothetical protein